MDLRNLFSPLLGAKVVEKDYKVVDVSPGDWDDTFVKCVEVDVHGQLNGKYVTFSGAQTIKCGIPHEVGQIYCIATRPKSVRDGLGSSFEMTEVVSVRKAMIMPQPTEKAGIKLNRN